MKVFVKATTRAKEERVVQINTAHFEIAVKELAKEGKANKAILRA